MRASSEALLMRAYAQRRRALRVRRQCSQMPTRRRAAIIAGAVLRRMCGARAAAPSAMAKRQQPLSARAAAAASEDFSRKQACHAAFDIDDFTKIIPCY
jgi:cell envelope opacity-associated protein A